MAAPPPRSLQHRSQSDAFGPLPSAPSHPENEKWPHPGQWSSGHEDIPFDSARNGRDRGSHQPISPVERLPPPLQSLVVPDEPLNGKPDEPAPKKRRKSAKNDTDNAPANGGQRRVGFHLNGDSFAVLNIPNSQSSRKSQRATKQPQSESHGSASQRFIPGGEEIPGMSRQLTDDHPSMSSDLEDCKEIWMDELDQYVLESKKRYQRVENWFHTGIKVRFTPIALR